MLKTDLNKLELSIYSETLENGLEVYVIPILNRNNIYATFTTKFGSNDSTFIPIGEKEFLTVSGGIAHFLEHKMFENEDGTDPGSFFSAHGADANAYTSNQRTSYLFEGPKFFKENLTYLIDYVQSPYFTDQNVLKEKGIIAEELKMYLDNPYSHLNETIIYNVFNDHPAKLPIGGTLDTIDKITKEELYKCYNTFYHPSNMFVVVSGNVVPEEVIAIIKEDQRKKTFLPANSITTKYVAEEDKVAKEFEELHMDIKIPKVAISFKFNYEGFDLRSFSSYMGMFFTINFGSSSLFQEKVTDEGIITDGIGFDVMYTDKHYVQTLLTDTKDPERFVELVKEELKTATLTYADIERRKKVGINRLVKSTDSIEAMNDSVVDCISKYKVLYTDKYEYIKSLNLNDAKKVLEKINFANNAVVIVKPLIDNKQ